MNYNQYISLKATKYVMKNDVESNDFLEFNIDNSVQNQGARDSNKTNNPNLIFNPNDNLELEGRRDINKPANKPTANRVTQSQVTFDDPVTRPEQPSEPPKRLRDKLKGLYSNFAKEVENACLIA